MDEILKKAILVWGKDAQINMAIQEMAELTVELTNIQRNRTTKEKLASEIVDVENMLYQLKFIFSEEFDDFNDLLVKEKNFKIQRIKDLLSNK